MSHSSIIPFQSLHQNRKRPPSPLDRNSSKIVKIHQSLQQHIKPNIKLNLYQLSKTAFHRPHLQKIAKSKIVNKAKPLYTGNIEWKIVAIKIQNRQSDRQRYVQHSLSRVSLANKLENSHKKNTTRSKNQKCINWNIKTI